MPRRRWTVQGRVVYDREPHRFTEKDVYRIMAKVLKEKEEKEPSGVLEFIKELLVRTTATMIGEIQRVTGTTGAFDADEVVREGISAMDKAMQKLGLDPFAIENALERKAPEEAPEEE